MELPRAVGDVVARRRLTHQKSDSNQAGQQRDANQTHAFLLGIRVRRDSTLLASQPALVSMLAGSFPRWIRSRECLWGRLSRNFARSHSPEFRPVPSAPRCALLRA